MAKKNIGFNATEEEAELFEKNCQAAGFSSNADFIKARCLNPTPSAQVRPGTPDDDDLETPEEKRQRLRISNVILKNLPISALNVDELKRYVLVLDAILKTHKVDTLTRGSTARVLQQFEPKYEVGPFPALPEKAGVLYCYDKGCDQTWDPQFPSSRRNHMIYSHHWTSDQLIAVGDL